MARAEIVRDHTGNLTLRVAGEPVHGAVVNGMTTGQASPVMVVHIAIPVQHLTFSDADNVLAFRQRDANQS